MAALFLVCAAARLAGSAEDVVRTPSDQMKEAVNKLGKTPATIGKSLQDLTEAAKEKLRDALGGKAAPGYRMAKLIIKLINAIAGVINADPDVSKHLKVVFLPDFNVKNSHRVYPAADLSEQISTAGKEASGTGNMKFAMNGALTVGTLDGANVEIRDAVGPENFFLFGLTAEEVERAKADGYDPRRCYDANDELREALDLIDGGFFTNGERAVFRPLVESLITRDEYMVLADYQSYVDCQQRISQAYRDQGEWTRMSILNTARVGRFSSDRSIRDYCRQIWNITPNSA